MAGWVDNAAAYDESIGRLCAGAVDDVVAAHVPTGRRAGGCRVGT